MEYAPNYQCLMSILSFSVILIAWFPLSRSQNQCYSSSHHVFIPDMQKEEEGKAKDYLSWVNPIFKSTFLEAPPNYFLHSNGQKWLGNISSKEAGKCRVFLVGFLPLLTKISFVAKKKGYRYGAGSQQNLPLFVHDVSVLAISPPC